MRITASLKDSLNRLLDTHTLFGGRDTEFRRLNTFVEQHTNGYLFVTALSGYGKTALLANWVRAFLQAGHRICYHFINRLYGKSAEEDFSLRNLCQQLAAYHDLRGGLPASASDLRALYPYLLAIPANKGQKLVVVLDGLDEAQGWIGSDLFPPSLPEGVFVVFSAREVATQDWFVSLELPRDRVELVNLKTLGPAEIAHLLRAAGGEASKWADDQSFVSTIYNKSEGDPFYLHYLVEDIRDEKIKSLAQVENQPSKLKGFLDRWWQEVSLAVSEAAVSDLLGYLLVAKGRLTRDDLTDISQEDALSGAVFERTIRQVQRYVIGDEKDGYTFCHPRFRDYVAQERIKEREQQPYRNRLLDYCARWLEHKREYALTHYAAHLAEAGHIKELLDLLNSEWLCTKWNHFGSYSAVINDFNVSTLAFFRQEPPDFSDVAALAVARQTARELMLNFPTALLVAWIRLGEVNRVLELVSVLGTVKGRAIEALTTVASELLHLKRIGGASSENVDLAKVAADLLGQAATMLSLVPSSSEQLEALGAITGPLRSGSGLTETQRAHLVQQVQAFAQSLHEPALQACALALVAEILATSEMSIEEARQLVEQAQMTMSKIDYHPDLLVATAYLIPALRKIDPNAVLSSVLSFYEAADLFEHSSLEKHPLSLLLEKWAPKEASDPTATIQTLLKIGQLCLNQNESLYGFFTGRVVASLCELGQGQEAVDLIRQQWKRSPLEGARAVNEAVHALYLSEPESTISWLDQAQEITDASYHDMLINRELFTSRLARSFAQIGEWERTIDLLKTVRPRERVWGLCECLNLAGMTLTSDSDKLRSMVDRLIELCQDAEADGQAAVYAAAAQALIFHYPALAKESLNRAASICLANLPEGDTDDLRQLLAIALHESGDYVGASAAIRPMKWEMSAVKTYARLIEIKMAASKEPLEEYVEAILKTVESREIHALFKDTLWNILTAARHLSDEQSEMSERLCNYVVEAIPKLGSYDDMISCHAVQAATRVLFDIETGLAYFSWLIETVQKLLQGGYDISIHSIIVVYEQLGVVGQKEAARVQPLLEQVTALNKFFPDLEDQVQLECAYAVALAQVDISQTVTILQKQLVTLIELNQAPPPAPHLQRMISEFVGRQTGSRYLQARAAGRIGAAIVAIASQNLQEASRLLDELLTTIMTIESPQDLAQALVDLLNNCNKGPLDLHPYLSAVYTAVLNRAQSFSETGLVNYVLSQAIESFCKSGNLEDARRASQLLDDPETRAHAENLIQITVERMELGTLSPLEQALVDVQDSALAYAVIHSTKVEGTAKEALVQLAEPLANDGIPWERYRLISDWVRLMIVPSREVGGPDAMISLISSIEDFDRRFLDAASLIAKQ